MKRLTWYCFQPSLVPFSAVVRAFKGKQTFILTYLLWYLIMQKVWVLFAPVPLAKENPTPKIATE